MENFLRLLNTAIGNAVDSPRVQELFVDQNIVEKLTVDKENDDDSVYVERKMLGYSLLFVEQGFVKNARHHKEASTVLILTGCHFNSEGYENYRQYQGELPMSVVFTDSRQDALNKLGNSDWQYLKDGKVKRERWEYAETEKQLNLTYSSDQTSIKVVYFGIREFFTK